MSHGYANRNIFRRTSNREILTGGSEKYLSQLGLTLSVHQKVSNKQKQSKTVLKGVPGEGKTQI